MTDQERRLALIEMLKDDLDGARDYYLHDEDREVIVEALKKQATSDWIPCSDRLPDRNGTYLITVSSYDETASIEYITVDHGNSDGGFLHFETKKNPKAKSGKVVTAWMPLPEPYKEVE